MPASRSVCAGTRVARRADTARPLDWRTSGTLCWRGAAIDRLSEDYRVLLDRAYDALFAQCAKFRNALAATGEAPLAHLIGKDDPTDTILMREEFCVRLERLRARLTAAP